MIVYMDGGSKPHGDNRKEFLLSWGIVAHHNDETVELLGCHARSPEHLKASHEKIAFVEAVRYVTAQGIAPEDVSFQTDDSGVVDANMLFHRHGSLNYSGGLLQKLKETCKAFGYGDDTMDLCKEFLKKARFTKLKGHSKFVYNLRCDYLAAHARNAAQGLEHKLKDFETWLLDGFVYYDEEQVPKRWYAAFTPVTEEA